MSATESRRWGEPMLATLHDRVFSNQEWVYEPKFDGMRVLCAGEPGEARLWSRNQKPLEATYPELVTALAEHARGGFVADGEAVAFEGDRTSFERLQARINLTDDRSIRASGVTVYYYLFDLLSHEGHDIRARPLRERKQLLSDTFTFTDPLRLSPHRDAEGERFHREACERGWEGLIAKRSDGRYRHGRSSAWLKLKCVHEQEFVVGGFTDPTGSRTGFGALLLGYYEGARLRYAGKVGTGYDERTLRELRDRLGSVEQRESPFAERVREKGAHWVRPEVVVEVGFTEWTNDGKLRHPCYTGTRADKDPGDVGREQR